MPRIRIPQRMPRIRRPLPNKLPIPINSRILPLRPANNLRRRHPIHKVISDAGAEAIGVVGGGSVGDACVADGVRVAQAVHEVLEFGGVPGHFVLEDEVVGWSGCAFDGLVALEEEVEAGGV